MSSGPTQNYDDVTLGRWRPHPVLAVLVRVVLLSFPPLAALAFGLGAAQWVPAARLGITPWLWLVLEIALAAVILLAMTQVTRRLLPVSMLLRLTVIFPDKAPSRFAVARRRYSPDVLRHRVARAPVGERTGQQDHVALLLDLVAAIGAHDDITARHSERVQAYAALIGTELGLTPREAAELSWAALLHDVGKIDVPVEILTKPTRPTDAEWDLLSRHPAAGMEIAAPLTAWLGPWLTAIGEHHERWDGGGYPLGLAGTEISRAARIVAVADAFDAFTSSRSYKTSLSASAARAELARCSGAQFDPEVVRAFLAVGLGRLRRVAGPASLLAGLPGLASTPLPSAAALVGAGTTVGATGAAVAVAGVIGALLSLTGLVTGASTAAGATATAGGPGGAGIPVASIPALQPTPTLASSPAALPTAVSSAADALASRPPLPTTTAAPLSTQPAPTSVPSSTFVRPAPVPCDLARAGSRSMVGADLVGCDLEGVTLTGNYSGVNLAGADLAGATLTDLDLTGATLDGAKLDEAAITDTSFDTARLAGASFTGATVTRSSFLGARLAPTILDDALVRDCTFDPKP
ncbi:MAG: HD domain-containing phosphohydrolase [Cellulomonas sp.]